MVNSVGKKLAETDRAYLAGMFDADGALMACIEPHKEKKYKFRIRLFVKIAQKNKKILCEIQQQLGWGRIRLNRGVHEYDIRNQHDIGAFIELIEPYVRVKQPQMVLGKQILQSKIDSVEDLLTCARLADALSSYNVRSKDRRKNYTAKIKAFFSSND